MNLKRIFLKQISKVNQFFYRDAGLCHILGLNFHHCRYFYANFHGGVEICLFFWILTFKNVYSYYAL